MVALNTHDSRIDTSAVCVANEPSCPGLILPQRRNGVDPGSPPRGNPARDCGGSLSPNRRGSAPRGAERPVPPPENPPENKSGPTPTNDHHQTNHQMKEKPPPKTRQK